MGKEYSVAAVDKAILILRYLAEHPYSPLSTIHSELQLSKSTTYQTLRTLEAHHFVIRTREKEYALGFGILHLAGSVSTSSSLLDAVRRPVEHLAEKTGLTVHFCVLTNAHSGLCLLKIDGVHFTIRSTAVGKELTMNCSAAGKAILAWLPPERLKKCLDLIRFLPMTENSIVEPERFAQELAKTRQQGYSLDISESAVGAMGIGLPIRNYKGQVFAAISIGAVTAEVSPSDYPDIVREMQEAVRQIEAQLPKEDWV